MLLGKKPKDSDKSDPEKALEERVDAMMSVERVGGTRSEDQFEEAKPAEASVQAKTEPPEAVEQKSAPALPAKLLKKVEKDDKQSKVSKTSKLPIVIKLTDPAEDEDRNQTTDTKKHKKLNPPDDPAHDNQGTEINAETSDNEEELADPFDDEATDEAVEEITANEADTLLAVEDAIAARRSAAATKKPPGVISSLFWFVIFLLVLGIGYVSFRYLGL